MNRPMGPVLAVVAVLVVGANATRLASLGRWVAGRGPEAAAWLSARAAAGPLDGARAGLALAMLLGAIAFVLAMRGAWLALEARGPRRTVLALARHGRPTAAIARRTRLSQDAVRTLLRPAREGTRLHA